MKKIIYLFFVALLALGVTLNAQVTNTVTIVADMTNLIAEGFDPATDTLEVAGLDWDDGSNVTITGDRFLVVDPNNANYYQTTLTIVTTSAIAAGDSLRWKFHGYPDANFDPAWEGNIAETGSAWDGRSLVLQADGSTFTVGPLVPENGMFQGGIVNTITFKADLTDVFGTGVGYFDPDIDHIEVRGFWADAGQGWVDASVIEGDPSVMTRNLDPGVVYETTLKLQLAAGLPAGTATSFKFKTWPDERWADGGWEIGSNTPLTFQEDGAVWEFYKVPNVFPKGEALGQDVTVLFQCYMPENALNRYDSSLIPRDEIEFIILKGDNPAIGLWGGDWVASDTLTEGAIALYDKGTHGDITAGDFIFSRVVNFADTLLSGGVIYKFGAQYPGASVASQSSPLDNSKGVGQNFSFFLKAVDTTIVLYDEWPTVGDATGVREIVGALPTDYSLEQNYPNPFNPATYISYSIPAESKVTLRIYDLLGREVATLVDQKQAAGRYQASFNASNLASGIYFYKLDAGNFTMSKKMMLVK